MYRGAGRRGGQAWAGVRKAERQAWAGGRGAERAGMSWERGLDWQALAGGRGVGRAGVSLTVHLAKHRQCLHVIYAFAQGLVLSQQAVFHFLPSSAPALLTIVNSLSSGMDSPTPEEPLCCVGQVFLMRTRSEAKAASAGSPLQAPPAKQCLQKREGTCNGDAQTMDEGFCRGLEIR